MTGPWDPLDLTIARRLASQGAPAALIGKALDRRVQEVDLALWTMLGRSPDQAAARLNGEPVLDDLWGPSELNVLQLRILTWLAVDLLEEATLAERLGVDAAAVAEAITQLADAGRIRFVPDPDAAEGRRYLWTVWERPQ